MNNMVARKNNVHPAPDDANLEHLRRSGNPRPLVIKARNKRGQVYYPVFLPFDARVVCPWCFKESAVSTYPTHTSGPRMCEEFARLNGDGDGAEEEEDEEQQEEQDDNTANVAPPPNVSLPGITQNQLMEALSLLLGNKNVDATTATATTGNKNKNAGKNKKTSSNKKKKSKNTNASVHHDTTAYGLSSDSDVSPSKTTKKTPVPGATVAQVTRAGQQKRPPAEADPAILQPSKRPVTRGITRGAKAAAANPPVSARKEPPPPPANAGARKEPPPASARAAGTRASKPTPASSTSARARKPPPGNNDSSSESSCNTPPHDSGSKDDDSQIQHLPEGVGQRGEMVDDDVQMINQVLDE